MEQFNRKNVRINWRLLRQIFFFGANPTRDTTASTTKRFSGDGNLRGHDLQSTVKYKFNKYLSAQIKGEFPWEGDDYAQQDFVSFLRTEVVMTF